MTAARTIQDVKKLLPNLEYTLSSSAYVEVLIKVAELELADERNTVEAKKAMALDSFASSFSYKSFG